MNIENNIPGQGTEENEWPKDQAEGATPGFEIKKDESIDNQGEQLETDGPDNDEETFNVLNQDGSLGDLPDKEGEGSGALDGTVGLGT